MNPGTASHPSNRSPLPGWLRAGVYLVSWYLAAQVTGFVVLRLATVLGLPLPALSPAGMRRSWPTLALLYWVLFLTTLWFTVWFWQRVDGRPAGELGFAPRRGALREIAAGLALGALAASTVAILGVLGGWYRFQLAAWPAEAVGLLGGALLVLAPAAALEEVSLRGYVLQTLAPDYGRVAAVLASAALFGLLHLANPGAEAAAVLGTFAAGIYLALGFLVTTRLYLPIGIHVAWNWALGPLYGLPVSGVELPALLRAEVRGPAWLTGGEFGPEAGALAWMGLALNVPVLLWVGRYAGSAAGSAR